MDALHSSRSSIVVSLELSQALALVRSGKFAEAERLLAPNGQVPTEPLLLQAHAALVTRAGNYAQALSLWRSLLGHDPQNAEARRMIGAIELWQSRSAWMKYVPAIVVFIGALILGVGLWWALSDDDGPVPQRRAAPAVPPVQRVPVSPPSPSTPPRR
jgi:tetratricopeptide (TPR) repeat protein